MTDTMPPAWDMNRAAKGRSSPVLTANYFFFSSGRGYLRTAAHPSLRAFCSIAR